MTYRENIASLKPHSMRKLIIILFVFNLHVDDCERVEIDAGPNVHYYGEDVSEFVIEPKID